MERRKRVERVVALRERQLELEELAVDAEAPVTVLELDIGGIEAAELDVGAAQKGLELGAFRGNDRRPARRQRGDRLRVRLGNPLDGSEQLQVLGADVRDDGDVRPGDRTERCDLSEPTHAHLGDQDLVSGSSRQTVSGRPISLLRLFSAQIVARVRSGERSQDVLRGGLAGRADDGHDAAHRSSSARGEASAASAAS